MGIAGAGLAVLLLGAAVPWAGWYGLRSAGLPIALVGALCVLLGSPRVRHADKVGLLAGLTASALLVERLVVAPADPLLAGLRSRGGLALALAGALLVVAAGALGAVGRRPQRETSEALHLDPGQRRALRTTFRAFASSRVLVWTAGVAAVLAVGIEPSVTRSELAVPFGEVGDDLAAPATAWDAGWYLRIAQLGYAPGGQSQAFFPLFPDLLRFGAWSPESTVVVGILVATSAFAGALYLLHRLVALEFDETVADRAVMLLAFSPMALFFSAIYTESLFLLLSVAAFYAARREAWWIAGAAGALAAATRPTGALLLIPLLLFYLRGPGRRLRDAAFVLAVPGGLLAYLLYCASHGDLLAPVHAVETYWNRGSGPLEGAWRGARDAVRSVQQLLAPGSNALPTPDLATAGQLSVASNLAFANLTDFAFLTAGVVATGGALRRLPPAYGLYAAVTVIVTVSNHLPYEPLASVPRYTLVLFPCHIWLALVMTNARWYRATVLLSGLLLVFFAARFATWHWVA